MLFFSSVFLISYFQNRQVEPLRGTFKKVDRPSLSCASWFDGSFQNQMDKRTNSRFFIRSVLIKIRNQIDFSLFDKVNADGVIKGKDNILFQHKYIDSYLGDNFRGEEKINSILERVKFLQDTLASFDKKLLVVIAASKGEYYSDKLPPKYDIKLKTKTNYEHFAEQLIAQNINHLDFNKMFLEMKDTVSYPLFSKKGIHWSKASKQFVWNTIVVKLEEGTDWKLARLQSTGVEITPPQGRDKDIYDLLNIYFSADESQMPYPHYTIDNDSVDKPKGIVIGDSFFWGFRNLGFSKEVLNDGQFWYYNKSVYPEEGGIIYKTSDYDVLHSVLENEIVILMCNASNLDGFPFGFESSLFHAFKNPSSPKEIKDKQIKRMIQRIRKNEEWFGKLSKESKDFGTPIDTLLYKAADYFLEQEEKEN